jgi:hypothetical protein
MKKLPILAVILAGAIAAPFAANQWQSFVERRHAYEDELAAEQAWQDANSNPGPRDHFTSMDVKRWLLRKFRRG